MPALKRKEKSEQDEESEVEFDLGDSFDVSDAKDDDFDLDMDAADYQGKSGQLGNVNDRD